MNHKSIWLVLNHRINYHSELIAEWYGTNNLN